MIEEATTVESTRTAAAAEATVEVKGGTTPTTMMAVKASAVTMSEGDAATRGH